MNDVRYPTFFDVIHCDATTRAGKPCRMVPAWVERDTGRRLCYVHAPMVFEARKAGDVTPPVGTDCDCYCHRPDKGCYRCADDFHAITHPHPLDGTHEGLRRDCLTCDAEEIDS